MLASFRRWGSSCIQFAPMQVTALDISNQIPDSISRNSQCVPTSIDCKLIHCFATSYWRITCRLCEGEKALVLGLSMLEAAVSTSSFRSALYLATFLSCTSGVLSGGISLIMASSLGENLYCFPSSSIMSVCLLGDQMLLPNCLANDLEKERSLLTSTELAFLVLSQRQVHFAIL